MINTTLSFESSATGEIVECAARPVFVRPSSFLDRASDYRTVVLKGRPERSWQLMAGGAIVVAWELARPALEVNLS
jgi:hypothetical protein